MFKINFVDDWIRTADLWYCKQLLYQLSHNLCPTLFFVPLLIESEFMMPNMSCESSGVGQLVKRSRPIPEVSGSNSVIGKKLLLSTALKKYSQSNYRRKSVF